MDGRGLPRKRGCERRGLYWPDGRQNPDTVVAAITYPKGFLYTYKTIFGNSYRSFARIQGRDGTIANYGGEGASLFTTSKEGGRQEYDPFDVGPLYTKVPPVAPTSDGEAMVKVPGAPPPTSTGPDDDDVSHMINWIESMQSRKQPNATVDHGFSHAIVCIMANPVLLEWQATVLGSQKRKDHRAAGLTRILPKVETKRNKKRRRLDPSKRPRFVSTLRLQLWFHRHKVNIRASSPVCITALLLLFRAIPASIRSISLLRQAEFNFESFFLDTNIKSN